MLRKEKPEITSTGAALQSENMMNDLHFALPCSCYSVKDLIIEAGPPYVKAAVYI